MVQFSFSLILVALAATGFATPIVKRTAAQVESDIATIAMQVTELDNSIKSFSGGVTAALVIVYSTGGPLFLTL
jgi:hypothetical protein